VEVATEPSPPSLTSGAGEAQPAVVLQLAQRRCAGGQDQAVVAMASVLAAEVRPAHEFLLALLTAISGCRS
jgi:hypothetical protein